MHSLRSTLLHSKQQSILVAELVPFAIATVFISLRIFSRRLKRAKLWLDDYFAICTYVLSLGWLAIIPLTLSAGLGLHIEDVKGTSQMETLSKMALLLFFAEFAYAFVLFFAKMSILCLYWRLFRTTNIKRPIQILIACSIIWIIIRTFMGIFHCVPVHKFWDFSVEGRCDIEDSKYFIGTVLAHIFLDMCIVALPIMQTRKLQLPRVQKIAISAVFMCGVFVCAAGLAIVIESITFDAKEPDLTWNLSMIMAWACVEVNLVTLSTCMPTVWPALLYLFRCGAPAGSTSRNQGQTDYSNSKGTIHLHSVAIKEDTDASSSTFQLNSTQDGRHSRDSEADRLGVAPGMQTTVTGVSLGDGKHGRFPSQLGNGILVENETVVRVSPA